jgi:hypothetical protein
LGAGFHRKLDAIEAMNPGRFFRILSRCGLLALCVAALPLATAAATDADAAKHTDPVHGGQRDFDFELGAWNTHLSRLLHPLTGSTTWVDYDGRSIVRKVWNGQANLLELEANGAAGHIEALSLRLYNASSRQWSLNFASSASGAFGPPTVGEFRNGRGEFYDQETLNGRSILVRFVISDITPNSCRFEQAFSADGGKTWEVNWVATDTRIAAEADPADRSGPALQQPPGEVK